MLVITPFSAGVRELGVGLSVNFKKFHLCASLCRLSVGINRGVRSGGDIIAVDCATASQNGDAATGSDTGREVDGCAGANGDSATITAFVHISDIRDTGDYNRSIDSNSTLSHGRSGDINGSGCNINIRTNIRCCNVVCNNTFCERCICSV